MYDDKIKTTIIDNLESKIANTVNTVASLASQGYLINKTKYTKVYWSSLLIHAFENIDILNVHQQEKIEQLYNEICVL